jgi:hypothetical protein
MTSATPREYLALAEALHNLTQKAQGQKHDVTGSAYPNPYGPNGVLSYPYGRPDNFSAIQTQATFLGAMPFIRSRNANEVIGVYTYQSANSGENPADYCGDPANPGDVYICRFNREFSRLYMKTGADVIPDVGEYDSYGTQPQTILNYARQSSPLVPEPLRAPSLNPLNENAWRLFRLGNGVQEAIMRIEVTGNSATVPASTASGWIKEFDGLQRIITDGIVDVSGEACPAADSEVIDWGDAAVTATVNGRTLPELIHDIYFSRQELARKVGMDGVEWALVMDSRLFRELVFLFSCAYAYARCGFTPDAGTPLVRDVATIEARSLEMMQGQFLLIEGRRVPVLFTSGAEVTNDAGTLTSSLFCVPLSWRGEPLTFVQYFDLNNPDIREWNAMANTTARMATNGGLYMFATRSSGFCDELLVASKMRLMCRAPFLGFKIDGIEYAGYVGYRDVVQGLSSFITGGVSEYDSGL